MALCQASNKVSSRPTTAAAGGGATAAAAAGGVDDQARLLEEARKAVQVQAFYMKRCLDGGKLMEALKHASNVVSELRTSLLGPKAYYELYMLAFDQLRHLESYLLEEKGRGRRMGELYELVQYAGNILPRLYLLITVGSVYIRSNEAPARDVLKDLVEMCRGVQHPTRGLFLRTYLSEMTKDKLPDTGSEGEARGGTVADSVEFILANFTEMNKLWVRMQLGGPTRDKDRRQAERTELQLLVGKNLARLSQLDGVDADLYSRLVLPSLLEQIVNCKDALAQQYLLECLIQVFPDEFHLRTLDPLLQAVALLQPAVDVRAVLVALIDRLAAFASRQPAAVPADLRLVDLFADHVQRLLESRRPTATAATATTATGSSGCDDILALQAALVSLALRAYPGQLPLLDRVLGDTTALLRQLPNGDELAAPQATRALLKLLALPLDGLRSVLLLLRLQNFAPLAALLPPTARRRLALDLVRNAVEHSTLFPDADRAAPFLEWIAPLLRDGDAATPSVAASTGGTSSPAAGAGAVLDNEDFEEEQNAVARWVHLLDPRAEPETLFAMYVLARKQFGAGGPRRLRHTLPPLVFRALALALRLRQTHGGSAEEWQLVGRRLFKFAHDTTTALARSTDGQAELPLTLFLQCAQAADRCGFDTIAYEFVSQALILYETEVSDSRAQYAALLQVMGALHESRAFTEDQYDTLVTKCAVHASKLLKKPDQARAVYLCSHLFWQPAPRPRDAKRVLECLQKALKTADACMDAALNISLFVEILDQFLYYYEQRNEAITPKYLNGLLSLINTNLANLENPNAAEVLALKAHYQASLRHIRRRKDAADPLYKDIEL